MILDIERAVANRLKTALSPLAVELMDADAFRYPYAKGGAVVMASGLSADPVQDMGSSVQQALLTLDIALMSRALRDGAGAWDLFETARRALQSFKPAPGATPLRLLDAQLELYEESIWLLATRWQTLIPLAPDLDYDGGPLLTTVTFEES